MIFGLLFLAIQTLLSIIKPKYFLFTYLLYTSSYLGLLPKVISIENSDIGLYYQSLLMIGTYFFYIRRVSLFPFSLKLLLNIILLFYLYGVLYPVLNGSSTLLQSVIASKEFSSLFLIHYLVIHEKSITTNFILKIISFFSYYFLTVLLIFALFNVVLPPQYEKGTDYIQIFYPSIISLFLFVKASQANTIRKKIIATILVAIWAFCMYFEGHTAILITTLLGCLVIIYRLPFLKLTKNYKSLFISGIALSLILLVLPTNKYLNELSETSAFKSRRTYNSARFELIKEKPLQGYGFLLKSATDLDRRSVYTESLSFIDSGYVDLLGKFGYIGTLIFLISLAIYFLKPLQGIYPMSLKVFFLQYFLVNITWAVFTFSLGTISLAIAIFLFYKKQKALLYGNIK